MENTMQGIAASKGTALGTAFLLKKAALIVEKTTISNCEAEIELFESAKAKAEAELQQLYRKAIEDIGEEHAEIFNVHSMMLNDLDFIDGIINMINDEKVNAAYAVEQTGQLISGMFASLDDDYMKARAGDVLDIANRVLKHVLGVQEANLSDMEQPVVVIAEDLYPSDTVSLDQSKVLAIVTEQGSRNSHTAILARTLGIPAIVCAENIMQLAKNGDDIIIDGTTGVMIVNPDDTTKTTYSEKIAAEAARNRKLQQLKHTESKTMDGVTIEICANIGDVATAGVAMDNGADGIGLFRSEFVYLDQPDFPTEDYQFGVYKAALEKMEGKRVIIRTLDLGADKQADYFNIPNEENPAMGYRAIRICLAERHIFMTQLRALLRASVYGKLAIMFPMVINEEEIIAIRQCIEQAKAELDEQKIAYSADIEIGIMIETPAAAVMSDVLACYVDFFSIGTNDLTQYTLAVDRMNSRLASLYKYDDPAVLRLMKMTVDNAHAKGVWVGICGESGGDLSLTERFIAMGIDELSCSPKAILEVREKVVNSNAAALKQKFGY